MKKHFLLLFLPLMLISCGGDGDSEVSIENLDGTWTISKTTIGYTQTLFKPSLWCSLDDASVTDLFGGTIFTFTPDGTLLVKDKDLDGDGIAETRQCTYSVSPTGNTLTMYIGDDTFVCHIVALTAIALKLTLSGDEVREYANTYTHLNADDLRSNLMLSILFNR